MSAEDVEAPVRARPDVPSATQTADPDDPAPVHPLGNETAAAEAAGPAAEVADPATEVADETIAERVDVRSALRLPMAEDTAKRVRALGPPQIVEASPAQGMLQVAVLVRAAPLVRVFPQ
jgi:hypothetical protein